MLERAAWAPSLGIEYHLGVDGLGALMLVLSAVVTLMSVDAAHRVRRQPGLYFALVLLLEAGLFGTFTALNFFHWFLYWELSLIPAFFLIKLWGGRSVGRPRRSFLCTRWRGRLVCCSHFWRCFSPREAWTSRTVLLASTGELEQAVTAHLGPVMMWLAIGVLAASRLRCH